MTGHVSNLVTCLGHAESESENASAYASEKKRVRSSIHILCGTGEEVQEIPVGPRIQNRTRGKTRGEKVGVDLPRPLAQFGGRPGGVGTVKRV